MLNKVFCAFVSTPTKRFGQNSFPNSRKTESFHWNVF